MRAAVLTSRDSWFWPYAQEWVRAGQDFTPEAVYDHHSQIHLIYDAIFVLSYFERIPSDVLNKHGKVLVVHESDLPTGRGWAPLFWQILEGKDVIPIVLFEAAEDMDTGRIYIKDAIHFDGHELHDEIRTKQAQKTLELCRRYMREANSIVPVDQKGGGSKYPRRTPEDSELALDKTLAEHFQQLRISSNTEYPAFFYYKGQKYIIHIERV